MCVCACVYIHLCVCVRVFISAQNMWTHTYPVYVSRISKWLSPSKSFFALFANTTNEEFSVKSISNKLHPILSTPV